MANSPIFNYGNHEHGSDIGGSKLTDEIIRAIRKDRRPQIQIAAEYGVSQANVSYVKRGVTWAHVEN